MTCKYRNCSNLTSISIPNSVTSIGGYAFSGTKWYDNQPDGVVYVGKILYKYKGTMPSNTKINIKEGTTVIAGEAFRGCEGLYSISIPNSVTVIENDAFFRCTNLKKATIEVNKYLNIKSAIFCENDLKELIMIGETLPQYTADDFAYGLYKITLYVPSSLYKKYRSTSPWSRFTNIVGIPDESINLTDMEAFAVIAKISIIGTVEYTDACKHRINNANNAYNALTDAQKELVSNIDVLTTAQQTYKNLKAAEKLAADKAKADPVIAKINAIGMVEYTDACKKRINDANDAYFFLTTDQQALVTNLDVLTTAKQTYANLKAAADKLAADKARAKIVINKIKAIGMVEYTDACKGRIDDASTAYEALTDDQKALVTNLGILTIAKQTYTALKIAAAEKLATDKAEADLVIAKINAICKVEYTNACKDKIDEANNAYNALTADQKALVTNLDVLKTAKQTYDNLKAAAEKLAADKVKADAVIAKIVAIGNVEYTDACKDKIDDANTAYEALTTDQKALVTNLDVLTTAKQTYDSLKAAAEKLAADKAAFDKYKSEIIAIIEALVKDDDSDAVKEIIRKAISDIESLEYEEAISIDDNKAKVKSFVTLTDEAVENQRAEDQKTNGIEELEFAEKYNIYDLNGRKITNSILKSGLYIRNGKKMVVK